LASAPKDRTAVIFGGKTDEEWYVQAYEEEGESPGILGKLANTVNTTKDIAYVMWNVGWRQ
jgi:hypothetical protein